MLCVSVRGIAFLFSALTLSAALGCGGGRATLSGDVSYDGAPVDNGTITFVPEGKGERVAAPVIDGKYAFDAETELCDNPPHGINDCGDSGVGCTNHGQSLLDCADACLLQMLIGPG